MVIDLDNYEDNDGDNETSSDISIGPVKDADTGEVVTPATETGDGSTPSDSNPGSTTVVVPESPAEREKLKDQGKSVAVGQGDTLQEAERDAARNPDFDADAGDSVNKVEKKLGTNQPIQNPEGSQTQEIRKGLEEIAGSERFQGTRKGRKAGKLAEQLENTNQQNRRRTRQVVQRIDNDKTDLDGRPGKDTIGEKLFDLGREGTFRAQQLSKEIQRNPQAAEIVAGEPLPQQVLVTPPNPFNILSTGLAAKNELEQGNTSIRDAAALVTPLESEEENKAEAVIASDLIQDTVEDTSAVVGGIGASSSLARKELRQEGNIQDAAKTVGAASAEGIQKQAEVLSNNPDEIRQEAIGLVGDVFTASVPTASVTPSVTTKASNAFDVVKTGAAEAAQLRANAKEASSVTQQVIESAALQEIQSQTSETAAVATETQPATQNPIAQPETSQITQETNFVPDTTTEVIDVQTGTTQTSTRPAAQPVPNTRVQPQSDVISRPESDTLNRPDSDIIDIPGIETQTNTSANTRASSAASTQAAAQTQTLIKQRANTRPTPTQKTSTSISIIGEGSKQDTGLFNFDEPETTSRPKAAPSVDAILFGETTEEQVKDETVFSGFETREISEDDTFDLI